MDVSAQTLREVEFREKLRGYHPDDVDEFLEQVAGGIEYLQERLRQATERAQRAEAKATESTEGDDALKRTLVLAQRTAEMAVQEARQEAERISASARAEANAIVAQAEDMARRTIEETQGGIRSELSQLETARDRLRQDIAALEQHLDEERSRLRASLSEALQAVEHHLAPLDAAPETDEVSVPPLRVPKVGPLPALDDIVAAFAAPEAAFNAPDDAMVPEPAEPEPFEIEIVHTVAEGTLAESPPMAVPAASVRRAEAEDEEPVVSGPLFDELADGVVPARPVARAVEVEPSRPEPLTVDETADEDVEDPFIAELRRAITDTQPLGPRDEGDVHESSQGDDLVHGDVLDSSRLGSLLRRRR